MPLFRIAVLKDEYKAVAGYSLSFRSWKFPPILGCVNIGAYAPFPVQYFMHEQNTLKLIIML
jgi:hypothetical protein